MYLEPLAVILLAFIGSLVSLMILYWVIRLAVRHGIADARRHNETRAATSGYWEPERRQASGGSAPAGG
jgi:hypothetical protein